MRLLIIVLLLLLVFGCAVGEPPPGRCVIEVFPRTTTRDWDGAGDTIWVNHKSDTTWYCGRVK